MRWVPDGVREREGVEGRERDGTRERGGEMGSSEMGESGSLAARGERRGRRGSGLGLG